MIFAPRHLVPRPGTLLLLAAMALCWLPILTEWTDDWATAAEDVGVPALVMLYVGLCGVYGATVADRMSAAVSQRARLALVFVRTVALGGMAVGGMALLS